MTITLDQAQVIVREALVHARSREFPPMTVAVLDATGRLVSFAREDGSSLLRGDIAQAKTQGCLGLGVGGRSIAQRAATHPHFISALSTLAGGGLVPVRGGVLIRYAAGEIVGAVGVSGHTPDDDEECAVTGIEASGSRPDPGQ